jgi:hypothetical protein
VEEVLVAVSRRHDAEGAPDLLGAFLV